VFCDRKRAQPSTKTCRPFSSRPAHGAKAGYPWAPTLNGGFTVLELNSREEAVTVAARIAKSCRCDQELRILQFNPQS
jgi:hypothetical protein